MSAKSVEENRKWRMVALSPIFKAIEGKYKNVLAQKLGISRQLLDHYLRGNIRVPAGFIDRISAELQLDPNVITPEARALIERPVRRQAKGA